MRTIAIPCMILMVGLVGCGGGADDATPVPGVSDIFESSSGEVLVEIQQENMDHSQRAETDVCVTSCEDKECGDDGCGGVCGDCRGEACSQSGICEPHECKSSKDCPDDLVCFEDDGICVQCVGDEDCGPEASCGPDFACHPVENCASDKDCKALNMVCDKTLGICVECIKSSHCAQDRFCLDGICLSDVCAAGESKCQELEVWTCSEDGGGWEVSVICAAQQYCEEAACKDMFCTPGVSFCDGQIARTCDKIGKAVVESVDCAIDDLYCLAGVCIEGVCPPGKQFCISSQIAGDCDAEGQFFVADQCPEEHFCMDGQCLPWFCSPNAKGCDGEVAFVCDDMGAGFSVETDCQENGAVCVGADCLFPICKEGKTVCDSIAALGQCVDKGTHWVVQDCPEGHFCDSEADACVPWNCPPLEKHCEEQIAVACSQWGTGYVSTDCTAQDMICHQGECKEVLCQQGDEWCLDSQTLGTCGEAGVSWDKHPCQDKQSCWKGECRDWKCIPGGPMCDETVATACDALGTGPLPGGTDCQEQGLVCWAGNCTECVPDCLGKECGEDGCGATCGECADGEECKSGLCTCVPDCAGKQCGDNGCAGSCGTCGQYQECMESQCVPKPAGCVPHDYAGCGGCKCEACVCNMDPFCCNNSWDSLCVDECVTQCGGCGDPTCGNGECQPEKGEDCKQCPQDCPCAGEQVCLAGQCCTPDCQGKSCGSDGCGSDCGSCPGEHDQCLEGACVCVPTECGAPGKECGTQADGCGGTLQCGSCQEGFACQDGVCQCVPDCQGKVCGDDLCGNTCGSCAGDTMCKDGLCVAAPPGCKATDSKGCGGCACEACVCGMDSYCCQSQWDSLCVDECITYCGGCF